MFCVAAGGYTAGMATQTEGANLFGPQHVERYRATDGAEGFNWKRGTHILLLTTRGRRSGKEYTAPLIFREDGDRCIVIASKGGTPKHPAWYLNLTADPHVEVQVKGDRFAATARTAEGEERERLWKLMAEVWPDYDDYQARTERTIPVVVLERAS
jgi:deazaflavin-dependent oxidoreductase (nitroreductase family)